MKLTNKQSNIISGMIRDEAERIIKGRSLSSGHLVESGPDMIRVNQDVAAQIAIEVSDDQGQVVADQISNQLHNIENVLLQKLITAGISHGLGQDDYLDDLVIEEDKSEIEFKLNKDIQYVIEDYLVALSQLVVKGLPSQ